MRFETINGTLCIMTEPRPLVTSIEYPYVISGIKTKHTLIVTKDMDALLQIFIRAYSEEFEVIGYPVAEGSAEWGEYQTQQGIVVRHKDGCVVRPEYDSSSRASIFEHYPTGWKIYKEPKSEPEQKTSPSFDVGDWVEVTARENIYQDKITFSGVEFGKPHVLARKTKTMKFDPYTGKCFDEKLCVQITRKLSHSEVVVPITISGTVRQAYNEDGTIDDEQFQLLPNDSWDGTEMFISFDALDSHTRKLVESLLKAQEEK